MIFGSLFAGIGGIDLGLERAGMECRWQVEIDPYCQKVLGKHWPDVPRFSDVNDFPPDGIEECQRLLVDLICAGFPCQDLSLASGGKGDGLDGERSGLFYEVVRVARELRPRYLLLENVPALLTNGMGRVLRELAKIGFNAEWHCIPASYVGADHRRDRVFILAYCYDWRFHFGGASNEAMFDFVQEERSNPNDGRTKEVGESFLGQDDVRKRRRIQIVRGEGTTNWEAEPGVGRVAYGVPNRMDRIRGLGNAVVPGVAEFIGRELMKHDH